MQLVAYGAQDLYLTGNPQMTFFKVVYNRYTNYANEYIKLYFHTNPNFDVLQFNQAYIKVKRQADLLGDCHFVVDMPPIFADYQSGFNWVPYLGYSFIHYISMEINGQEIDKNYGQWLIVWTELTMGGTRKRQLLDMISYREVPFILIHKLLMIVKMILLQMIKKFLSILKKDFMFLFSFLSVLILVYFYLLLVFNIKKFSSFLNSDL